MIFPRYFASRKPARSTTNQFVDFITNNSFFLCRRGCIILLYYSTVLYNLCYAI